MTVWWHRRPPWLRWSAWAAVFAAIILLSNLAKALDAFSPWIPATRAYVGEAVTPVLVVSLRNTIEIIEAREASIKTRMQMASNALRFMPGDAIATDALAAATRDFEAAENQKTEALCNLREARGLQCGR